MTDLKTPVPPATTAEAAARGGRRIYYGYWLVFAAFLAQFVGIGSQNYAIGPFLNPMTEEFGWSHSEFTLARTLGQFVLAVTGVMIGVQVDRHGGRLLMRAGIVILAVAMFGCAYVQELWQWWLLNGVMLTTGSAMIGNLVVNVTLAKWFVERRGRMIGIAAMGVSLGGIIITPFATTLVESVGWRDAWRVLALCALVIVLPLSFLMRRAPEDHGLHPDGRSASQVATGQGAAAARDFANSLTRAQALRTSSFYMVSIAFGLGILSVQVVLIQSIAYMTSAGHSEGFGAFMITMTSIPATFLKPVWGYVLDKLDVQRVSLLGFLFNAVGLFVIVTGVRTGVAPVIASGFFILGLGWSGFIPIQEVIWATFFGRRHLGAVRSAGLPLVFAFSASGPLLAALYYDRFGNYDGAFLAIAALTLVGGVVLAVTRRPRPAAPPHPEVPRGSLAISAHGSEDRRMLRSRLGSTARQRAAGLVAGALLDQRMGDPPNRRHPVAWIGGAARAIERYAPADAAARREFGAAFAFALPALSAATAAGAVRLASKLPLVGPVTGAATGAALLALASSQRTLLARAEEVALALERGDLEAARTLTATHLVSRDTSELEASQVAGAAIASVAENLADGVIAPWWWFVTAGAPGAWAHRAANTLDAVWGYRDDHYAELGMTAARLDDALNLLPSRLTALAILSAARGRGTSTWWRDHGLTDSPNAGHPMAAMAGVLGVELTKDGQYVLGSGNRAPDAADVRRAIQIARRASRVALVAFTIGVLRRPR